MISRYHIVRSIGRGAMGEVLLAEDRDLDRLVTLKRITGLSDDPGAAERSRQEARIAGSMAHPHIVTVYDTVSDESGRWLVMEYFPSKNLADVIRESGALAPDEVVGIFSQISDALAYAHERGIAHRDVKPSNILIGRDPHSGAPRAKLADFGIARAQSDPHLTGLGFMIGTPAYFSPELAGRGEAGLESDAWALGASMYHALTAEPPYGTTSSFVPLMVRIATTEPPRIASSTPVSEVVTGLMDLDPRTRWTVRQAQRRLKALAADPPPSSTTRVAAAVDDLRPHGATFVHDIPDDDAAATRIEEVSDGLGLAAGGDNPAKSNTPVSKRPNRLRRSAWIAALVAAVVIVSWIGWLITRDSQGSATAQPTSPPVVNSHTTAATTTAPPPSNPLSGIGNAGRTWLVTSVVTDVAYYGSGPDGGVPSVGATLHAGGQSWWIRARDPHDCGSDLCALASTANINGSGPSEFLLHASGGSGYTTWSGA